MAVSDYLLAPLKPPLAVEGELQDPQSNSGKFEPALEEAASTDEQLGRLSIASCTAWLTGIEFAVIHGLGRSTFPYNWYADRLRLQRRQKVLSEMRSVPEHRLDPMRAANFAREVIWPCVLRVYVPRSWYSTGAVKRGAWRARREQDRRPVEPRAGWPPRGVWHRPVSLGEAKINSMLAVLGAGRPGIEELFAELAHSDSLVAAAGRYLKAAWETAKRDERGGHEWSAPVLFGGGEEGMVLRLVAVPAAEAGRSNVCQESALKAIEGVRELLGTSPVVVPNPDDWRLVAGDFPGGALAPGADGPGATIDQLSEVVLAEHVEGPSGSLSLSVALLGSAAGLPLKPNTYASGIVPDGRHGRFEPLSGGEELMASKGAALAAYSPPAAHPLLVVGHDDDRVEVANVVDGKVTVVVADTLAGAAARMLRWSDLTGAPDLPPNAAAAINGPQTLTFVMSPDPLDDAKKWACALQWQLPTAVLSVGALGRGASPRDVLTKALRVRLPRSKSEPTRNVLLDECIRGGDILIMAHVPARLPAPVLQLGLESLSSMRASRMIVFSNADDLHQPVVERYLEDANVLMSHAAPSDGRSS